LLYQLSYRLGERNIATGHPVLKLASAAMTAPLTNISDTARWVAVYRAMESERPDAIFRDPYARRLAGPQGEAIVKALPQGRTWAWPMIVRTAVFDELILRTVERDGVRTVLNLAAGLDTRPYRLPLPRDLQWLDADLPAMVAYKRSQLAGETPQCRLEFVEIDLRDTERRRALFARATGQGLVLAVTEGLLIYLTPEQAGALADDLAAAGIAWWLIDIASPRLLQMMRKSWQRPLESAGAPFQFAPEESTRFFESHGWREREWRSIWEESLRLKRTMRFAWLWNLLGRLGSARKREQFRRFSGIALLERRTV
jgi:methyltransferase (TIGR00027 family)